MKQNIKLQGKIWTLSFTVLSVVGCFYIMFYFDMFGKKINYIKDLLPNTYVALCLGFGIFFIGVYVDGQKGGFRYLRNWFLIYIIALLIGYLRNS